MANFVVPTTNQLPVNPKISVYFRGLGVICFNNEKKRAEIGYLNVPNHEPQITITASNNSTPLKNESMAGKNLVINSPIDKNTQAFFIQDDPRNLNSLMDLSHLYGEADIRDNALYHSKIYIDDAVFSADGQMCQRINVIPYNEDIPSHKYPLKTVSRVAIADVKSNLVSINYGREEIPVVEGVTYSIAINSSCPHPATGDFKYYYDLLKNGGTVRYNLDLIGDAPECPTKFDREYLKELLTGKSISEIVDDYSDEEMIRKSEYLEYIKCFPGPCLLATFGNVSRSL